MAARRPKDVSAWLGGNRGTVQSGGGKPMGIVDDIVKGIKDIASPWLPAAPGQNKSVTQAQGLARAAAETLDQTVTGGLVQAGTQGNKALAKQAAINAAALGAGYVAGKAIQTAANAAAKTGLPQRFVNTITNKKIVVHATGNPVEGKYLRPAAGSPGSPDKPVVFSWSTDFGKGKTGGQDWIVPHGADYGAKGAGQQNYVIAKTSRKNTLGGEYKDAAFDAHPNPVKIVKIVQNPANDLGNFVKELKTAGVKTDANLVTKILEKKAAKQYSNSLKKSSKKSVM